MRAILSEKKKSVAFLLRAFVAVLFVALFWGEGGTITATALGGERYVHPETGYAIYLCDEADLLSEEEEMALIEDMKPITEYGGIAFVSGYYYDHETAYMAEEERNRLFGKTSSAVFMIDMGNRNIFLQSGGDIFKIVNKAYANTITDNIYRYATRGEYYACAKEAYGQMQTLLAGGRIAQPMKYITNALIALILALFVNFALVRYTTRMVAPGKDALLSALTVGFITADRMNTLVRRRKHIRVDDSGGGSFGGGSSGGFSGGGGGFSSGGGGHSF